MKEPFTRRVARATGRQAEPDLHWLTEIVDSSDDAIISKTLDGVISTWNRSAERLFGYSAEEAIGQPITIIIPPELHAEEREILRRLRAGERIDHHETRRITRDGRWLDVSVTISPVRDARGTIVGASKVLRDITEDKRAHRALRASQRQLAQEVAGARTLQVISTRLMSESTQESLIEQLLDAAVTLMAADAASLQVLTADESTLLLLGSKNFHPDSAAYWHQVTADTDSACGRALLTSERVLVSDVETCEFMAGTRDREEYRRSGIRAVQSTPLRSRSGRPLGMLSTHWRTRHTPSEDSFRLFDALARQASDLIERARAEDALRESEERFRLIATAAPVAIWMSDLDKQCTYVNERWVELTGRSLEASVGRGWLAAVHPEDVERSWAACLDAFTRREPFQIEYRIRRDDEYRWVVSTGVPRYTGATTFTGYIGSVLDITDRKLAETALSTVSQRLIEAQEEERLRLARELHDDINQRLALLSMRLGVLLEAVPASAAEERQQFAEARKEVLQIGRDVQALSHRLHPPRLEHLGMAEAAAALCREITSQRGVDVAFRTENVPENLPKRVVVCLYRILQESLQNAIKHSGAATIAVSLDGGANHLELTVEDSGVGFDRQATQGQGLGLISMTERLKAVDGWLLVRSAPGRGTSIRAHVPLPVS